MPARITWQLERQEHDGTWRGGRFPFRLDSREAILQGGASGAAAVLPGHSERNRLIDHVSDKLPESEMPPAAVRERFRALTADDVALLRA